MGPSRRSVTCVCEPLLALAAGTDDELIRRLVLARLGPFGRLAPGRRPVLAALGSAAIGMVDRVHGDRAHGGARPLPTRAAGLADGLVQMVGVGYRTYRRHAFSENAP